MPCLKIVPEAYVNCDALGTLVHGYIFPKSKIYGGLSVDPAHAAEQMQLVKALWMKESGRQLLHFIVSFSTWESDRIKSAEELIPLAYEVCQYYAADFQIVFGIHLGRSGLWHVHFVVNSVSFTTGKRILDRNSLYFDLGCYVQSCLPDGGKVPVYFH